MRTSHDRVQALFLRQHGVAARFQLVRLMSAKAVDGLVRRGSLVAVERGVYRSRTTPVTRELLAMAALLRSRPAAVLTGCFVLGLVDVDGFTVADPFTVLTRPGRSLTQVTFRHRPDVVDLRPPIHVGPLASVHPTVAVLDAIRQRPGDDRRFRVAIDVLRRRGQWIESRLSRELAVRPADDPGARFVRDLLGSDALACETEPERLLGHYVREVYPDAEPQVWITPRRRSDWYLRGPRLAIEFQGEVDHGHAAGRAEDAEKAAEAEAVGIRIVPVVKADLEDGRAFVRWLSALVVAREFELERAGRQLPTIGGGRADDV
jgi:hypothetical protein